MDFMETLRIIWVSCISFGEQNIRFESDMINPIRKDGEMY